MAHNSNSYSIILIKNLKIAKLKSKVEDVLNNLEDDKEFITVSFSTDILEYRML